MDAVGRSQTVRPCSVCNVGLSVDRCPSVPPEHTPVSTLCHGSIRSCGRQVLLLGLHPDEGQEVLELRRQVCPHNGLRIQIDVHRPEQRLRQCPLLRARGRQGPDAGGGASCGPGARAWPPVANSWGHGTAAEALPIRCAAPCRCVWRLFPTTSSRRRGSVAGPLPRSCARPCLPGHTASHGSTHEQQTPVSRLDPIHLAARTLAPASALVPRAPPRRRETCLSDAQVGETLRCAAGPISNAVLSSTPPQARPRPRPRPSWR
jgi:hypothetical protein